MVSNKLEKFLKLPIVLIAVLAFVLYVFMAPVNAAPALEAEKRADASTFTQYETHDAAWAAIGEAHNKGEILKSAYIKSTGTLISNIKFEEQYISKRFSIGGIISHFWPKAGHYIPGISFTENQVNSQGTYFTAWEPSSCVFYNDKSTSDVRHDFTTTLTKTTTIIPGFDVNLAGVAALKIGAEITKTNTLTRLDSYTIKAGTDCQTWVRPLMLWQNQQFRQCKKTSLTSDDKTCTSWGKVIQAIFLVQNKTIGNLRCGEANILKNQCGS